MIRTIVAAVAIGLTFGSTAGAARAQGVPGSPGAAAPKDDLTTLERSLAEQHDALSTSDCANACRALASIRRAADKICALDPGDRCAAGRAKADDATRRVREACPECALASVAPEPKPRDERAMTKGGSKAAEAPQATSDGVPTAQTASAPPSESRRGGCAGCTTTAAAPGDLTGGLLAGLALAYALRRRRRA